MRITGGSDLARLQMLQEQAIETRNKLDVAGQEMSSSLKADRFKATGGNLTRLFALERSLDRNEVFANNISLTEVRLDTMQESLGRVLASVQDLSLDLSQSVGQGDYATSKLHAATAREAFLADVGTLNTAGRGPVALRGHRDRYRGDGARGRDPRRHRRAGRRHHDRRRRRRRDRRLLREVAAGRLLHQRLSRRRAGLTPVQIGEGQTVDYGLKAETTGWSRC